MSYMYNMVHLLSLFLSFSYFSCFTSNSQDITKAKVSIFIFIDQFVCLCFAFFKNLFNYFVCQCIVHPSIRSNCSELSVYYSSKPSLCYYGEQITYMYFLNAYFNLRVLFFSLSRSSVKQRTKQCNQLPNCGKTFYLCYLCFLLHSMRTIYN